VTGEYGELRGFSLKCYGFENTLFSAITPRSPLSPVLLVLAGGFIPRDPVGLHLQRGLV
jgi:hypothetical protein